MTTSIFSSRERTLSERNLLTIALGFVCLILLALVVRMLMPNPTANLLAKAQRLEAAGQLDLALRYYAVLTKNHPESLYAPRAWERQGAILTGQARGRGDAGLMRKGFETYLHLGETYPESSLAGDALITAGNIALTDLRDWKIATRVFALTLDRYPNNREYASESTLKLGRIALAQKNGQAAQTWFQRVLQRYPKFADRCAEAQYHLGVAYETLFRETDHMKMAKRAYEATFKRYPQSIWASDAKERLGLLYYVDSRQPQERRVFIDLQPLPVQSTLVAQDSDKASPLHALRLLLASRGLMVDATTLRGWSLAPFWAAFDAQNPARVHTSPHDQFDNILASTSLHNKPTSGGQEVEALRDLQDELDTGRAPLVWAGSWMLAVGYDSSRGQVFLQRQGARMETIGIKEFAAQWKNPSPTPIGRPYTMLSFFATGERPRPQRITRAAPGARPLPTALRSLEEVRVLPTPTPTPVASLTTPTWMFEPQPLSLKNTHRRALRNAALLMKRPQHGKVLLNLEALAQLSRELERLAQRPLAVLPSAETVVDAALPPNDSPLPAAEDATPQALATQTPLPSATPGRVGLFKPGARARALGGWFKNARNDQAPVDVWIAARRDAAAYLDSAANALGQRSLQRAAAEFRTSIERLEEAVNALPSTDAPGSDDSALSDEARAAFGVVARHVRAAHDAEKRALALMSNFKG